MRKNGLIFNSFMILLALFWACSKQMPGPDSQVVQSLTGGVILRTDPILVVFAEAQDSANPPPADLLTLKPETKGRLFWEDPHTLVFAPQELLLPGTGYTATVGSQELGIPTFSFNFSTHFAKLDVLLDPLWIDEQGKATIQGVAETDFGERLDKIEQTIFSPELGRPRWTHDQDVHRFAFDPLSPAAASRTVEVGWTTEPLGGSETGVAPVRIPGTGLFEVLGISVNQGAIEIVFSSPLRSYSDLRGFILLNGSTDIRYAQDRNVVKVFSAGDSGITPGMELTIQEIQDIRGRTLAATVTYRVPEGWELPDLRFAGNGTILPSSQGTTVVLETRNISGVLVEAFLIYDANMRQFLQVNPLAGSRELTRVGEPVWTGQADFAWRDSDINRWVRRGIDLSELSRKFPGGMFRIRVTFRHRHIQYECTADHGDFSHLTFPDDSFPIYSQWEEERSYWDSYQNVPEYSSYGWYTNRMDPCHPAFYYSYGDHAITKGRNILLSDLGLLAKRSLDGAWVVWASNIKTAQSVAGVDIQIQNNLGRILYQGRTGPNGMVSVPALETPSGSASSGGPPRFVIAQADLGKAYLRIDDSLALASSHFDLAGDRPLTGLRGLIYGERDVWRPGDDIYLTFLLSDPAQTLPPEHPVSFTLEDPRGRIAMQRTYTQGVDGFYPIIASTAPDALTGDWTARIAVGGNVFSRRVKIETIIPNRLKMDLDFGGKTIQSRTTPVSLEAHWLYGAVAPLLKGDITLTFADRETSFPGYPDYSFRDPTRKVASERITAWEGALDAQGRAAFTMELDPGAAVPGKLTARFLTRIFEPSGLFSSEQIAVEFSPYTRYLGLRLPRGDAVRNMLVTDQAHTVDMVVLDGQGALVTEPLTLEVAVYKLSWRWWWEQGGDEAASFNSALSRNPIMQDTLTVSGGKASWNFTVPYPEWGRYLVMVRDSESATGHAAGAVAYIDWPNWASRAANEGQGASAMLVLTPDKASYPVGETVSVSFPSNREAQALVTIEKGGQLVKSDWIRCEDTQTVYRFPATPDLVPNVYVHVTLLQPHMQTINDLPIRLYGITPVLIEDPRTTLRPTIEAPDTWLPESQVSFTVGEESGRAMVYTVAVVDEGLLGLTRYQLPNPRNTFYAREASFLKSWDLYSEILGAYSGQLETLLAIGGGDDGSLAGARETQRWKPVVQFFGPYELRRGEKRQETFTLPPYNGALRIMVLAASPSAESRSPNSSQRAFGTQERTVTVSSDLMVFGTIPRTLSPGDVAEIPVSVAMHQEGARTVQVSLAVSGATVAEGVQQVRFDAPGEKTVLFTLTAPGLPGTIPLAISAQSPGLRPATHSLDLEIRSTATPVTHSAMQLISSGETWTGSLEYPGRPGTNTGSIELSRSPSISLEKRLDSLIANPHTGLEQTVSKVFPQLYLDRIMSVDADSQAEIRTHILEGIERLMAFQTVDGGFSYWPGYEQAHIWGTSYAGLFLLEARRAGYPVPEAMLRNWLHFQKDRAALWQSSNNNPLEQAYRLYTLALAGEADLGSMNRLRELANLSLQARWRLAAAYWYAGQRDIARRMVQDLAIPGENYRELGGTFGSTLRDKAMILETLLLLEVPGRTRPLFEELASALSQDGWLSTQEIAYALLALSPYLHAQNATDLLRVDCSLGNRQWIAAFDAPIVRGDMGSLAGSSGSFSLQNRSAVPLYARVTVQGLPEEGAEPALSEGLSLSVAYWNGAQTARIDPNALPPGEDMIISITLRNTTYQNLSDIALLCPLSAPWEIINTRLGGEDSLDTALKYQDMRDDRIMYYFDLDRGAAKTITIRVNKTYRGQFYRPAIHAYALYDESIRALLPGARGN